ncbi:MAG: RICIN domain-containing protein [Hyphomonadaceae bacterium]
MRITAFLAWGASLWLGASTSVSAQEAAPAAPPAMTLQHERLPGMCVSLSGLQGQSESRPCNASPEQEFRLPVAGAGPILSGDKCVAPRGQGAYPQLYAQTCDGTPEQQWAIKADGEIRNAAGRCLSLLGASSRTGERVYAGECPTGLPANHWRAVPADATLHPVSGVLESVARPGKCLGTDGALGLVDCKGRLGRVFSFDTGRPGQLRMMSSCLAAGFAFESLSLGQCWDMPEQKWSLTAAGNLANLAGKCIVIAIENGRDALRTGACLPVPEQQWTLKEVVP